MKVIARDNLPEGMSVKMHEAVIGKSEVLGRPYPMSVPNNMKVILAQIASNYFLRVSSDSEYATEFMYHTDLTKYFLRQSSACLVMHTYENCRTIEVALNLRLRLSLSLSLIVCNSRMSWAAIDIFGAQVRC